MPPEKPEKNVTEMSGKEVYLDERTEELRKNKVYDFVVKTSGEGEQKIKDDVIFRDAADGTDVSARHEMAEHGTFKTKIQEDIFNNSRKKAMFLAHEVLADFKDEKSIGKDELIDETAIGELEDLIKNKIEKFYETVILLMLAASGEGPFGLEAMAAITDNEQLITSFDLDPEDEEILRRMRDKIELDNDLRDHLIDKILVSDELMKTAEKSEVVRFKDGYIGFVVYYMTPQEKVALFDRMIDTCEYSAVAEIMDAYLSTGIINIREAREIFKDRIDPLTDPAFAQVFERMDDDTYLELQHEAAEQLIHAVDVLKKSDPDNPFWKWFTVENLVIAEVIGRWGMLTLIVNLVANWNSLSGILTNPYIWAGLAVMAGTAEYITGGLTGTGEVAGALTTPSKNKFDEMSRERRVNMFRGIYCNYEKIGDYFYDNFDELQKAYTNKDEDSLKGHYGEETFTLLDIEDDNLPELTDEDTFNGVTVNKAEEYISLLCMLSETFDITSPSELSDFIQKDINPFHIPT